MLVLDNIKVSESLVALLVADPILWFKFNKQSSLVFILCL